MLALMRVSVFAFATLLPAALLLVGSFWGGPWIWAAPVSIGLIWVLIDPLTPPRAHQGQEFPGADGLLALLAILQLTHVPLAIWALTVNLEGGDWIAALIGFGLYFGQIGNPAAHELIHRSDRWLRGLGTAVYVALLFGHHVSAHRLVHHVHVATPQDPNTARKGLGFWRFLPRAWIGSFRAGLEAERALIARAQGRRRNPYRIYVGGAVTLVVLAALVFGAWGALLYLVMAAHAQSQLLVSDYVQHYGLKRARMPDGRYEPVGPRHSWNAAGWYSAAVTLNAPLHSDHHAHPARPYPQLRLADGAPLLPAPLPAMACVALIPPLWRKVMDPRLAAAVQPAPGGLAAT